MNTSHDSSRSFRFRHNRAAAAFGIVAAGAAIVSAAMIFGPLADQKVLVMSGSSSRTDPSVATSSTPLRVASTDRLAVR